MIDLKNTQIEDARNKYYEMNEKEATEMLIMVYSPDDDYTNSVSDTIYFHTNNPLKL